MPRFRLETALHVRERLEKLYQKALAEQVKIEQQYRDSKQLMEETLNHHHKDLDESKSSDDFAKDLESIELKITRLGAINLAAMEEFEQEEKRKELLDSQHQELMDALETLQNATFWLPKQSFFSRK